METNDYWQLRADLGSGYSHVRALGEGGMGTLYQAHKDSLDVDVVIKRVKQKFKGRMDERAEANILKTLKHKYLPRIYDVVESPNGYIYTIMDLIQGVNMQQYISTHGPVDQKTAYRWACQLCEVMVYLHAQTPPILHCDIKPSNVMITPNGDICLIDFNTSLVFSGGELAIGATPGYAAPEQYTKLPGTISAPRQDAATVPLNATIPLGGYGPGTATRGGGSQRSASASLTAAQATNAGVYGTISKRTDVYGIGATIYFAVTGERPAHSLHDVKPITAYKLRLSRSFQSILLRAMRKKQEERFCDAQELLRALQDIHTIDSRYKNVVAAQWAVSIVSAVLCAAGVLCIVLGLNLIQSEKDYAYDSNVRRGRTAGEATQFAQAEQYLQDAIAVYDDRLEAYAEQAVLLYRQGLYAECLDAVNSIFARPLRCDNDQEWANLCYVAGRSCDELAEYASAVQWYQRAIQYSPGVASYYRDGAIACAKNGDLDAAEKMLDEMAQLSPEAEQSVDYKLVLAQLYLNRSDPRSALEQAKQVIRTGGSEQQLCRAYVLAAQVCEQLGEEYLAEEISLLEDGAGRLSGAYYNFIGGYLGLAYARQADLTGTTAYTRQALEVFEQMQTNGLNTFSVRMNIAVLQEKLGRFEDAQASLEALAEDYPNDYRIYKQLTYLQAEIESKNGSRSFAKTWECYQKALALYQQAQATGTMDAEMAQLGEMMDNLR